MLTLKIPGRPQAKKRPRFARRGKFTITYSDQETEEGRFILEVKQQLDGHALMTGPISMIVRFDFERPKSHFGTGRNSGKLKASAPAHHISTPDCDNCLKFLKDCLNRLVWKDDCQVFELTAIKRYSDTAKTTAYINEIEEA